MECKQRIQKKQKLLHEFYMDYISNVIDDSNYIDDKRYNMIRHYVFEDIQKYRFYYLDGRAEDSLIDVLSTMKKSKMTFVKYADFIKMLVEDMKIKSDKKKVLKSKKNQLFM